MRQNYNIALKAIAVCTGLVLIAPGCNRSSKPSDTIVIGEYGSITGSESTFGVSTDNGIKLAVKQINEAGGIDGHKLEVKLYNDEGKSDTTNTVVNRLISQDKPTAIIGEVASGLSITAAPICNRAKVPMISPASTNPDVTKKGEYIFRVCFLDEFQGYAAAKFAIENLHAKNAAVMTDPQKPYSVGLSQFFKDNFTKMGGKIVAEKNYSSDDQDFHSALTDIAAAKPDILYVPGYYTAVGSIAKQARQVNLTIPLMGGDGWDSQKLVVGAGGPGGALEGCYFTNHYSVTDPKPETQKFVQAYVKEYGGAKPDALAALGYDAAEIMADSIKRAGKPANGDYSSEAYRVKLRDAIASTKDYKAITGVITIGPDRNAVKSSVVLQVKGNDFDPVATIEPPKK